MLANELVFMSDGSKRITREELKKKAQSIVDELPVSQLAVAVVYLEGLLARTREVVPKTRQTEPRGSERRVYKRLRTSLPVVYKSLEEPNVERQVSSLDISGGGISYVFLAENKINLSDYIEISFTLPDNRGTITVQAQVRRAVKRKNGAGYEVGVEFLNITEEQRKMINEFIKLNVK